METVRAGVRVIVGAGVAALVLSACATSGSAAAPEVAARPSASHAAAAAAVEPAIQRMIAPTLAGAALKVLSVAGPVRGWLAVAVSPPYREFPTVVLFREAPDHSWSRVFEALTPGVQGQRSTLLDLHTKGLAFDYTASKGSRGTTGEPSRVTADAIRDIVSLSKQNNLVTVAHAYFFHSHQAGEESYFVDRTATYDLARRLFPGEYEQYPRDECTMFDVPGLQRIQLTAAADRWLLTAETDNGQLWEIAWTGVDDRGFLTGKTVHAKRVPQQ